MDTPTTLMVVVLWAAGTLLLVAFCLGRKKAVEPFDACADLAMQLERSGCKLSVKRAGEAPDATRKLFVSAMGKQATYEVGKHAFDLPVFPNVYETFTWMVRHIDATDSEAPEFAGARKLSIRINDEHDVTFAGEKEVMYVPMGDGGEKLLFVVGAKGGVRALGRDNEWIEVACPDEKGCVSQLKLLPRDGYPLVTIATTDS